MSDVTNVHECMNVAQTEGEVKPETEHCIVTFRVERVIKDKVTNICEAHGNSVSAFLRACCVGLVSDYQG